MCSTLSTDTVGPCDAKSKSSWGGSNNAVGAGGPGDGGSNVTGCCVGAGVGVGVGTGGMSMWWTSWPWE